MSTSTDSTYKEAQMLPKQGFKGWLCSLCGHIAERAKWGPWFECSHCDHQHAEWTDEVQS